ncbi:hypothetical protein M2251_000313 [Rhodococcus erythropolis]|nr:hypothetical protein [Rhodococcus erythropolis]
MTKILGLLSFGHYRDIPRVQARTARDALTQAIDIAVGAEELGLDGAWIRVHHYQRQFATPWALLSAMAARTSRIELGTAVIDMRYENPLIMAELAAAADLISGGRLQTRTQQRVARTCVARLQGVRNSPDLCGIGELHRATAHRTIPWRDLRCADGRERPGTDEKGCTTADRTEIGNSARSDLVGICHTSQRAVGRNAGDESSE